MKKIILCLLTSALFLACSDNEDDNQIDRACNSNFSITVESNDGYNGDIGIYFFEANDFEYNSEQDINQIIKYTAINNNGEEVHSCCSYINNGNIICCDISPGKYFVCVILSDTKKYSISYIEKKNSEELHISKIFESMSPLGMQEKW
jgi:hypothetical protein